MTLNLAGKPVLEALLLVTRIDGPATLPKVAKAAGLPYARVLRVLDANAALLARDNRGRVVGTTLPALWRAERERALTEGRAYVYNKINYDADTEITCHGPVREELQRPYWCGFLGDCHEIKTILATPENIAAVRARGLVHVDELDIDAAEPWKEGAS